MVFHGKIAQKPQDSNQFTKKISFLQKKIDYFIDKTLLP